LIETCTGAGTAHKVDRNVYRCNAIKRCSFYDTSARPDFPGGLEQDPRLEVQGLAARPVALLSRAQRAEVLHRLGHVVAKKSHLYPPRPSTIDIDVEKHLFIVEGSGFRI
jgi:hypothetical protein